MVPSAPPPKTVGRVILRYKIAYSSSRDDDVDPTKKPFNIGIAVLILAVTVTISVAVAVSAAATVAAAVVSSAAPFS